MSGCGRRSGIDVMSSFVSLDKACCRMSVYRYTNSSSRSNTRPLGRRLIDLDRRWSVLGGPPRDTNAAAGREGLGGGDHVGRAAQASRPTFPPNRAAPSRLGAGSRPSAELSLGPESCSKPASPIAPLPPSAARRGSRAPKPGIWLGIAFAFRPPRSAPLLWRPADRGDVGPSHSRKRMRPKWRLRRPRRSRRRDKRQTAAHTKAEPASPALQWPRTLLLPARRRPEQQPGAECPGSRHDVE